MHENARACRNVFNRTIAAAVYAHVRVIAIVKPAQAIYAPLGSHLKWFSEFSKFMKSLLFLQIAICSCFLSLHDASIFARSLSCSAVSEGKTCFPRELSCTEFSFKLHAVGIPKNK